MTTVQKACNIIFANEGNYGSINLNDNGAVSIGKVQWHGNRARDLLLQISFSLLSTYLPNSLLKELEIKKDWSKRTVNAVEASAISRLLKTIEGKKVQDKQAEKDVQSYILHIMKYDVTNENTIILLADIENQGGAGATDRIIKNCIKTYGKYFTLDQCMSICLTDKVFKKYQNRRFTVYEALTDKPYGVPVPEETKHNYTVYTVKSGDNLTKIANKYKTTVSKLVKDNNIKDKNLIIVGQKIKIY